MQHHVSSSGSHQFLRDSDLFFLRKLGGNSAAVDGVELPETGPSWSLHAVPDGSQVQMPGIAIGQHPAHRNMRDWFGQESVLSASRRKSCKGSLKKAAWPQGNNAPVGISYAIFILIMKGFCWCFVRQSCAL